MNDLLNASGFFNTRAPFRTDLTLVLILFTAVLFTIGWQLAVRKHYTIHRWVQTTAVCLNAVVVLASMPGSFVKNILPGIPAQISSVAFVLPAIHGFVGAAGLLLGVFVMLRGNGLVPKALQFKNYKLFMRLSFAMYILITLLGVAVYFLVYVI